MTSQTTEQVSKSALQDNIESKGKNAYYFAHAHKATGPKWDGKAEPRLLSSTTSALSTESAKKSGTFDYNKSNITSYAFLDEPAKVKLYIELRDVGTQCSDDDIDLQWSERSFSLTINNYKAPDATEEAPTPCLCFTRLSGRISKANFKKKDNKIILTLWKVEEDVTWHTINDKGSPDHEVV